MQQPPQFVPTETKVIEYRRRHQYERDANKLGRQGWQVVNVQEGRTMEGLTQQIWKGTLFLPRQRLIVTYQRPLQQHGRR